ncbi:MAG: hypothetical protein J0L69_16250 [Bacteroidetes bacterium]|nr:hypothetical protein [Bacteroidota bacterium]
MKSSPVKNAIIIAISLLFISALILTITENNLAQQIKKYFDNYEMLLTIIYAAIIVVSFNLLIFIIGALANKKEINSAYFKQIKRNYQNNRRRRLESRYVNTLSRFK